MEGYSFLEYLRSVQLSDILGKYKIMWKMHIDEEREMEKLLTFSKALDALKEGKRVAREGWNGKGMYITKQFCTFYPENLEDYDEGSSEPLGDVLIMYNAQGTFNVWLASQTDVLAEDWVVL